MIRYIFMKHWRVSFCPNTNLKDAFNTSPAFSRAKRSHSVAASQYCIGNRTNCFLLYSWFSNYEDHKYDRTYGEFVGRNIG